MYGNYNYQPSYQTPYYPQTQPQRYTPTVNTNIEYANGVWAVHATPVPPNSVRLFLDSESKYFYIKRTDAEGRATVEVHPYTDVDPNKPTEPQFSYVTLDQFNELKSELNALKTQLTEVKE